MVARAVRLHQRHALVKAADLKHTIAVCVLDALNQPGIDAWRKSYLQACYAFVRIRPLKREEPAVTGQRAGFSQATLNVFQATCDLTVRDLDISLKVAGFLAAVELTEAVGLCGNGEIS